MTALLLRSKCFIAFSKMIPSPENHSLTIFLSRILHDFLSEKMCIPCIPQKYLKLNKVSHGV